MSKVNSEILNILPHKLRQVLKEQNADAQEIRLRVNKHVIVVRNNVEEMLKEVVYESDIREALDYISGYSMYAYEDQLREGFITIKGGHRVGIVGRVVMENQGSMRSECVRIKTIKNVSSINIRVSHQIVGCSDKIMKFIKGNVLIVSPPGMGKTTLLRDIVRNLGNMKGQSVGVVDERSEIAACYMGIPQNDLGERTDVLDCCPKPEGMMLLLRSMSPTYIGVDELGSKYDIEGIQTIINSGTCVIATIHGDNVEKIKMKPLMAGIMEDKIFETFIELGKNEIKVYDADMLRVY